MRNHRWFRVLLGGIALELISIASLVVTGNPVIFPTTIMLGSFTVPASFATYFYTHGGVWHRMKFINIVTAFFIGGLLGVLAASFLEPFFITKLDFATSFGVGLIEEGSKLLGIIIIARSLSHTDTRDGIALGVATGMGFASLESMGYSFTEFLRSGGNLTDTLSVTLIRALLSPIGHGIWSGILGGVLFTQSREKSFRIDGVVLGTYLFVAVLHGLWDGLPYFFSSLNLPGADYILSAFIVAIVGIYTLSYLWRSGRQEHEIAVA